MHPALSIIAQISHSDAALLRPDQTLSSLKISKSLGLGLLRSALERRFQRKLPLITWKTSIQELLDAIDAMGGELATPISDRSAQDEKKRYALIASSAKESGTAEIEFGHGIDIQEISALPATTGKWEEHPFYASHFTTEEMTVAGTKPDARAHLAGLWSAKEAVRKSDPELLKLEFTEIAITHDVDGRPSVRLGRNRPNALLAIIVSISHSSTYAIGSAITRRR